MRDERSDMKDEMICIRCRLSCKTRVDFIARLFLLLEESVKVGMLSNGKAVLLFLEDETL